MKALLAVLIVVSMVGIQFHMTREDYNERLYHQPLAVIVDCINTNSSLAQYNNMTSSSRRSGINGEVLIQWSICKEV